MREHVPLAPFTTLGVGGPARWFVSAEREDDVQAAVAFGKSRDLPLFILGGGSNLIISDAGFPGLVLHVAVKGISLEETAAGRVIVTAAAGEDWNGLVQFTVDLNLQGMECLAGIPGTVGGTPVQNVGAYGQEVAQTLTSARCYDMQTGTVVHLRHADFGFGYRTSLLNTIARGRYIILAVSFALVRNGAPNLSYADLQRTLAPGSTPSLAEVSQAVRTIRKAKGMVVDPADPDSRSAGSFFRNPIVPASTLDRLANATGLPQDRIPHWPAGDDCIKLPAAWLLERAGFVRGYELGNAGISSKHTLALINRGGATERDIAALRERILAEVQQKFGITLEQEPVNVG